MRKSKTKATERGEVSNEKLPKKEYQSRFGCFFFRREKWKNVHSMLERVAFVFCSDKSASLAFWYVWWGVRWDAVTGMLFDVSIVKLNEKIPERKSNVTEELPRTLLKSVWSPQRAVAGRFLNYSNEKSAPREKMKFKQNSWPRDVICGVSNGSNHTPNGTIKVASERWAKMSF